MVGVQRTLIAVNLGEDTVAAPIPWSGTGKLTVVGENRTVAVEDLARETLGRFVVHVYQGAVTP